MSEIHYDILMIDDDEDDVVIIRSILAEIERYKFHVEWAPTYEAGLDSLKSDRWSAVLVDYDLGPKNGIDLIREAISRKIKTPMIIVTGRGRYEIDLEAMEAGAADYLSKNEINPSFLERTIRYAVERRRDEEVLEKRVAERTRELQLLLDQIPAILWSTDRNLVITSVQGLGLQTIGMSPNQLLGQPLTNILQELLPGDQPDILSAHQRALAGESSRYEINLAIINVYLSAYVEPIRDGDGTITGCIGIAINITDQKQVENELRASMSLLDGLFTSVPDAIFLSLEDGTIFRANQQAANLFGYTALELTQMQIEQLIPARFRATHAQHWAEYNAAPQKRIMGLGMDLFGLHKNRHEFPIDVTLNSLVVDRQTYIIYVVKDLSQREK